MLCDMFYPQKIVIGSMARYLPEIWLEQARAQLRQEIMRPQDGVWPQIVPAQCAERLQDLSTLAPCVCAQQKNRDYSAKFPDLHRIDTVLR